MARQPMVTRTIKGTKVRALCVDTDAQSTYEDIFTLARTYKDNKSLMKKLESVVNDDTHKVVSILATETTETLYGMSEQDFISCAKVLPPRNA